MEEQIRESWWKRNWKWALPTGGCLTILIIAMSFIGYGIYKVGTKLSEDTSFFAFFDVIQKVQKSPDIIEALGKPIRLDGFSEEDYNPEESTTHLDLDFEIQGSQSEGMLRVVADKVNGKWEYSIFTVTIKETGEVIDIKDQANEQ